MLRRSARLQHTHEEPQTATDSKQNEAPRGRKRARTASSSTETPARSAPRRRIAGFLERFAKEAPLDVCLEVFKYLQPRDLLHLARTSKALRGFLMSNSSQLIWRTARENVPDLPPLPPDLNEPQYASLLFDTFCYARKIFSLLYTHVDVMTTPGLLACSLPPRRMEL
ncbi:hypothetical protein Moror_16361 [Moniliophthora roreri MCA 2997]|uniref:F-box domain-containing protein n=1 Tax=Moniliophthora roreri (strain MCA 2997) TaxID=1381753 RepID=V2WVR6_MONRO|nr:hypothetical protein Moror_16361 [Moniliophthora roreri MCA 2997]